MTRRILVTGSRTWTDVETIRRELRAWWCPGAILVTGACPEGADRIAGTIWVRAGQDIEEHPADWAAHGKSAGFRRNAEMVASRPEVCLAFIRNASPGASHCARLAEQAGIPTFRFEQAGDW